MKNTVCSFKLPAIAVAITLVLTLAVPVWAQDPVEAGIQTLDEENLKNNVAARVRNTRGAQDEAFKTFNAKHLQIDRQKSIQIGGATVYAVQLKIYPPTGDGPPDLISVVVDAAGTFQFSEIQSLADGRSMVQEALAEVKRIDSLPPQLGKEIFSDGGDHDVVVISDPFCPYCRKGWQYLMANRSSIKTLRLAHFPLNAAAEATVWAVTDIWQNGASPETIQPSEILDYAYSGLQSSQNPQDIVRQFLEIWPELKTRWGEDAPAALQYLRQNYQAAVQKERDQIQALGIQSTPIFFVNGEMVEGFNAGRLDALLGKPQ